MVRLRDILQLAWTGNWYGLPDVPPLDLPGLIALTVPSDWTPPVASVDDWNTNEANGGNDLDREKALQIAHNLTDQNTP